MARAPFNPGKDGLSLTTHGLCGGEVEDPRKDGLALTTFGFLLGSIWDYVLPEVTSNWTDTYPVVNTVWTEVL